MRSQPAVRHVGLTWRAALAGVALLAALFGAGSAISALAQALAERNLPAPPSTAQMTPDEITARLGFTALWPTSLPPSLTWSGAEVGGPCRRADGTSIRTSGSFIALWRRNLPPALEPALRLQEEGCGGLLPDGRPIPGRGRRLGLQLPRSPGRAAGPGGAPRLGGAGGAGGAQQPLAGAAGAAPDRRRAPVPRGPCPLPGGGDERDDRPAGRRRRGGRLPDPFGDKPDQLAGLPVALQHRVHCAPC